MVTKFLNIDTDNTLSANSNERVPSQKAVKTYTDNLTTSKQNKVLDTPITVESTEETTVEGALGAINTSLSNKQNQSLSSAITVDGTQQTTVEGTLNALNIYANSKQNNLTAGDNITINNNVISANVPANVYTADNLLAGDNITFVQQNAQKLVTYTSYSTYIYKSSISTSSSYTYEYQIKFTYIPTGNYQCLGVFNASSTGNTGPWGMYVDDAGTNIVSIEHLKNDSLQYRATANTVLVSGTTYWIKLICDGAEHYNVKYSTDGETWADLIPYYSAGGTMSYPTANFYIGAAYWTANGMSQRWLHNTFDLNQTYLKINGNYIFNGQDASTYTIVGSPTIVNYTGGTTVNADLSGKQDTLVSGTNIKTVNNTSLLGSGNITIDSLPSQTGNQGKYLTTDGSAASWSDKPLVNEASNNIQLNIRPAGGAANTTDRGGKSIIIGSNIKGGAYNDNGSIRIGNNINSANYNYGGGIYISPCGISKTGGSIIIDGSYDGLSSNDSGKVGGIILAGDNGSKIGPNKGAYSVIIGSSKQGTNSLNADNSTFIGNGNPATTITEDNTFWWGNDNGVYKLVDTDGTIPVARLNTMIGADGTNAGAKGAVPAPAATDNTKFLKGDGTWANVDTLPSQTGQSGKFLTTDGTDASWSDKPLVNAATYTASGMVIGGSDTGYPSLVAVGKSSKATLGGTAVGYLADAGIYGIAIGYNAKTTGSYAIQLNCSTGNQTNADANTFKVGNQNGNFELMSADGTIPVARLNTMTGATAGAAGAKGAVPAPSAGDNEKFLRGDGTWVAASTVAAIIREW